MVQRQAAESHSCVRRFAGATSARARRAGPSGAALELVRGHVAAVLGYASAGADRADPAFRELGFDSLLAVELRNRLSRVMESPQPATLVFDYPTPESLAGHLLGQIFDAGVAAPPRTVAHGSTEEWMAIVGMGCRYPGDVSSPQDLWQLVSAGADAISAFPVDRGWQESHLQAIACGEDSRTYAREGGFVYDAVKFDAAFFGIGSSEALAMDPQQRLLLETCWEALEDAGFDPFSLKGTQAGVFAGISSQYLQVAREMPSDLDGYGMTGGLTSVVSGRVAYTFGFEGPAVTIDTACSSSLVAIHLAVRHCARGNARCAGGRRHGARQSQRLFGFASAGLAADGRCKPFLTRADGGVLGGGGRGRWSAFPMLA